MSSSSSRLSAATTAGATLGSVASQSDYRPMPESMYEGTGDGRHTGQPVKRRKMSASSGLASEGDAANWSQAARDAGAVRPLQQTHSAAAKHGGGKSTSYEQGGPAPTRHVKKSLAAGILNKAPSVQYMNAALTTNGAITSLLDEVAGNDPRPIQVGRTTDDGDPRTSTSQLTSVNGKISPLVKLPITNSSGNAGQNKQAGWGLASHKAGTQVSNTFLRWQALDEPRKDFAGQIALGRSAIDQSNKNANRIEGHTTSSSVASDGNNDLTERYHSILEPGRWSESERDDEGHFSDASGSMDSVIADTFDSKNSVADTSSRSKPTSRQPSLIVKLPIPSWSRNAERTEDTVTQALTDPLSVPRVATIRHPIAERPARAKFMNHFSEEEEHLLIFLKEVKKLRWKQITSEFQKYYPSRVYHTLQSRYTTSTNKRNRDEDPATLKLPMEWANEATIDWSAVYADTAKPHKPAEISGLSYDAEQVSKRPSTSGISTPRLVPQPSETDYSSGGDISMHVRRPRRAPPVNYNVRRRNRRLDDDMIEMDLDDGNTEEPAIIGTTVRRDSSLQTQSAAPATAHVVTNPPLEMTHDASDAVIALRCRDAKGDRLPYLGVAERLSLQNPPESWEWNQLDSRLWQGMLVHVDFSTTETSCVERALAKHQRHTQKPRHCTQRRQLRSMLGSLTEPQLLRLANDLQRCLPARELGSIVAFLHDARAGRLPEAPQILRLSAARPQKSMTTSPDKSTSTMLRQRELGLQSRRGWRAASRTLIYPVRNKIMDTLGPSSYWTGASSDIHTVAWSPDGETFAAGAVAVTDQDSMQYNRPNNLLFGNLADNEIHELPCHSLARPISTTGANSTHAMFVSQDPELYTTVTSVRFSPCGSLMYSAGYDKSLCIWNLESTSAQPELALKLKRGEEIEMMDVNQHESGVIAIASRKIEKAIKLVRLDEQHPRGFQVNNFQSEKAASRSDRNILPQALRFEPKCGTLLLAGFGANAREDNGLDTNGDLCLWDIETHAQMSIYGSNKNVFDVAFNPNQRSMPLFAAGCVASGNVNRGMRSLIRLFEHRTMDKYTSPLEIECRALDMNDVVWCPQDEHLIAAGCTDGRVYVWDLRKADDPLRVLAHGPSLMPLQEGVPHERTDTGIRFLSWGDNATRLYSGSSDGIVKVWDVTQSVEDTFIKDLVTADSGIMAGAFSPDFSKLLIGEVNGSVDVLEVGKDDYKMKDASQLRYVPYHGESDSGVKSHGDSDERPPVSISGSIEGDDLLRSGQLQLFPMGNFPTRQVVQGPNYAGPFDRNIDAPALRQQALEFQMSLTNTSGTTCDIPSCKDSIVKVTSEEFGDSGRSVDRIPDELRKQWMNVDATTSIIPGKTKCIHCGRPALPSIADVDVDAVALCERCCFACFRCGAANPVAPATTQVICDSCGGVWEAGALGYKCVEQSAFKGNKLDVPPLRRFGREILEDYTTEGTTYGDEMNALSDYYFSLAIDRPDSPPL